MESGNEEREWEWEMEKLNGKLKMGNELFLEILCLLCE